MKRLEMISQYKSLPTEQIALLIKQKKGNIDIAAKVVPYNGDDEWIETLKNKWWSVHYEKSEDRPMGKLSELRDRLLSIGGCDVVLPIVEDDIDNILKYGQLWDNISSRLMKGRPCQCHSNSAELWYNNRDSSVTHGEFALILCTGYALSRDGLWRQHSWLVQAKPRSNVIIETTRGRVAYYGFGLTYAQANEFYDMSW